MERQSKPDRDAWWHADGRTFDHEAIAVDRAERRQSPYDEIVHGGAFQRSLTRRSLALSIDWMRADSVSPAFPTNWHYG
jgi:hypothetical protein